MGTGISAINQLTNEGRDWIEQADLVCYCVSEPLTAQWIQHHAQAWLDLAACYDPAQPRRHSYAQMVELVLNQLQPGRTVVMALYGHPGIAAAPGHSAIRQARAAGHRAWMLPGISAVDVLFSDLGIDPCRGGCHWFEATDFLLQHRQPDVLAHVILWQIGALHQSGFTVGHRYRSDLRPLQEALLRFYPPDHTVIHYQAAQQVVQEPLIQHLPLNQLVAVEATGASTLLLQPLPTPDRAVGVKQLPSTAACALPDCAPSARVPGAFPSAMARLIEQAASNPLDRLAFEQDRGGFLARASLDPVERWALLRRHAALIRKGLELGSAQRGAVALGIAPTEAEALTLCRSWLARSDARRLRSQALDS